MQVVGVALVGALGEQRLLDVNDALKSSRVEEGALVLQSTADGLVANYFEAKRRAGAGTALANNTVAGGVPSAADVKAAVDDMEERYAACGWRGRLDRSDDLRWIGILLGPQPGKAETKPQD